jgi:multidrug efflux pump subunit AcrA (membrane-fusion protein)
MSRRQLIAAAIGGLALPLALNASTSGAQASAVGVALVAPGVVSAPVEIPLDFATEGRVASVAVTAGETVHKGQLLATLETTSAQSAVTDVSAVASLQTEAADAHASQAANAITDAVHETVRAKTVAVAAQQTLAADNEALATDRGNATTAASTLAAAKATLLVDKTRLLADRKRTVDAATQLQQDQALLEAAQTDLQDSEQQLQNDRQQQAQDCGGGGPPSAACQQDNAAVTADQSVVQQRRVAVATARSAVQSDRAATGVADKAVLDDESAVDTDSGVVTDAASTLADARAQLTVDENTRDRDAAQLDAALTALDTATQARTAASDSLQNAKIAAATSRASGRQTVDEARVALEQRRLLAPTDGIVGAVDIEVGEQVLPAAGSSGTPSITFLAYGFDVAASFAEADAAKIRRGDNALVQIPALDNLGERAIVVAVAPMAEPDPKTGAPFFTVKVHLSTPAAGLRVGMTARVLLTVTS